ncbi:hypothetical protein LTR91_011654 [Friedmanniomyces endolithicus]|uniref:Copper-fist domain-containing protein n=1 Tax=Friedmanniomyces endolithicus TaxID=329885 RepID=A0AAN6KGZ4_9PEZI|nr:hypothetical protein LTR94_003564 [Friedmanniomyces endolithicus]KAK0778674.1 hypothetical protein LTR59_013411 [Friedmanniomyces endolithicus]KAK0785902.1 hypothetical protein LTR38_012206 [Friedmanniomyces endolithicus]KAK0858429.1 hypothetical protein LTS02_009860 [Friedmanniomyces endolithicus]KAK0880401.1 hypothetical protein LTR87_005841 [Friedmanniomyces endolithicus]
MDLLEKPFKTIEVIDVRTNQVCKVACMSCIRGHRTTACGIAVCRSKVFWTVKRPGRPSNSCSCRYGATGGCKCVVARCEEQGRFCCLIEPEQWEALMALQKPVVQFFATPEALDASHGTPTSMSTATTPAYLGSPRIFGSLPGTPARLHSPRPLPDPSSPYIGYQSPPVTLTPRFGMMGIGGPQGSEETVMPDVLAWDGQVPLAPREYQPPHRQLPQEEEPRSCCQSSATLQHSVQVEDYSTLNQSIVPPPGFVPFSGLMPDTNVSLEQPLTQPTFDFNKLQNDYYNYQFPSAICQTCGLSGCTCRNCPPVMQSSINGSWAQCCGRKHARTAAYVAPTVPPAFEQQTTGQALHTLPTTTAHDQSGQDVFVAEPHEPDLFAQQLFAPMPLFDGHQQLDLYSPPLQLEPESIPDFTPFDPGEAFALPGSDANIDLSDYLMEELEPSQSQGCCCGDR